MEDSLGGLPRDKAVRIIAALRKGTPPEEGIDLFSVGRLDLLSYFERKLDEVKTYGVSDVKFISGDWGHGKSHFLDLLRESALNMGFVVSKAELSSKEAPFDQLNRVIERVVANVSIPESHHDGMETLLDLWSDRSAQLNGNEMLDSLRQAGISPDMRLKLMEYRKHRLGQYGPEIAACLQTLRWFLGKETKSKTFSDVREYLRSLTAFILHSGYSGFIVMLDEAEAITSLSRISRRDLADENIRQFIDNDIDTRGFYFLFASTPTFLDGEDERGARSYQALWRRISNPLPNLNQSSFDKVIVDLPKLSEEEHLELATKIKAVYEIAYGRSISEVTADSLNDLAQYVHRRADQRVGTMVRSTVAILDEAAQSTSFDFSKRFGFIVEAVIGQEKVARAGQ